MSRFAPVLLVLAAVLIGACTGGGDDTPTPTTTPDGSEATPAPTRTPPPARTPVPTATPTATPVPSQTANLEVIVEFAVSAELHNLAILEMFSGGFEHELLSPEVEVEVEVDLKLYELLIAQWEHLASIEGDTLAALEALDNATVARAGEAGATRPIALEHSRPAETAAASSGLLDSAAAFFGWVGDSGTRSRERILTVADAMSDAERDQLFAEWQQFYPEASSGVNNGSDLITRLRAGDLDANASRIHGQLLEVSNTSVDAPRYGQLAQDEGLLLNQVVVEEGIEGLKRGAEFNVDATVAVLKAQFPRHRERHRLRRQGERVAGLPGRGLRRPDARRVRRAAQPGRRADSSRPFGEQLDAAFEGVAGELSGLVSSAAEQLLGFDSPSAALGSAADLGFARLEEGTRAAIADGGVQQVGGDPRAGLDDLIPTLTVAVPDPEDPVVTLPQGTYDVQGFDEEGVPLTSGVVAVEAGWEKPVGPEASALPTPLLRVQEVEAEVAAEAEASAGAGADATVTPIPTETRWVKVSPVINPDNDPTGINVEATQGRRTGTVDDWEIAETSFSHRWKDVDNGYTYWDWTFTYSWDAPPDTLEPGEPWPLEASGSRAGKQEYSGFPGEAFEYRLEGGWHADR